MPSQDEQTPLLSNGSTENQKHEETVRFEDSDPENPRNWSWSARLTQTIEIFLISFLCPMVSSIFAPAMETMATEFKCSQQLVLAGQTGFVCAMGASPLLHAPMSETFGRRNIFVVNLAIFTLLQIPIALAPNVETFVAVRTLSGVFGSVGIANGGGSIFDMFGPEERDKVLGFYLLAPLLGISVGPFIGGVVNGNLDWRWMFWISLICSAVLTVTCYFFLSETNAVAILQARAKQLQKKNPETKYKAEGSSDLSLFRKIAGNSTRAIRILTLQPVVTVMSIYQALIFTTMYTLYAEYGDIWSSAPYNFTSTQLGLAYFGPGVGFMLLAVVIILYQDRLAEWFARRNNSDEVLPEYVLALANIGAIGLPLSLFWFGWAVEYQLSWPIPFAATILFGASQVSIFNPVQAYLINSYQTSAASALAAGAFLRSQAGAFIPLFMGDLFARLGYGWGISIFGFLAIVLMPAPLLFQRYGKALRDRFPFEA